MAFFLRFSQFTDAKKAAYGNTNPLYAITQFAQSSMRSEMGKMELDKILHVRGELNESIKEALSAGAEPWGLTIKRYEITEVRPEHKVSEAMDKQAVSERSRRELVKNAEGAKEEMILQSEGAKRRLINESEGEMIKVENEAKAFAARLHIEAEGEARAMKLKAEAQAEAVKVMADALSKEGGMEAAQLALAKEYVSMYGQMGSKSNTMLFQDRPADMSALMAQAATVLGTVGNNDSTTVVKDGSINKITK
jgi:regulator of protease activity HflC (stomatin/prohibitin superfamily)